MFMYIRVEEKDYEELERELKFMRWREYKMKVRVLCACIYRYLGQYILTYLKPLPIIFLGKINSLALTYTAFSS